MVYVVLIKTDSWYFILKTTIQLLTASSVYQVFLNLTYCCVDNKKFHLRLAFYLCVQVLRHKHQFFTIKIFLVEISKIFHLRVVLYLEGHSLDAGADRCAKKKKVNQRK